MPKRWPTVLLRESRARLAALFASLLDQAFKSEL
jgi:hypothetical protein